MTISYGDKFSRDFIALISYEAVKSNGYKRQALIDKEKPGKYLRPVYI